MFGAVKFLQEHIRDLKSAHAQQVARLELEMEFLRSEINREREDSKKRIAKAELEKETATAKLIELLANSSGEYQAQSAPESDRNDGLPEARIEPQDEGIPRSAVLRNPRLFTRNTTLKHTIKHNRRQVEQATEKMFDAITAEARKRAQEGMANQAGEHAADVAAAAGTQ